MGRLADMYGGYLVFNAGFAWFTLWSLIAGFSSTYHMLIICRAMTGLGAAAVLPAGIMLLGRVYRPGPRKNFVFSLYGAICPIGFFLGMFIGGLSDHVLSWRWYFWLGAMPSMVGCLISLIAIPRDFRDVRDQGVAMDWLGTVTLVPGLLLLVFAITNSSQAPEGWSTPYIYVSFVLGLGCIGVGVYVEGWIATSPLIPADLFEAKYMKRVAFTLFVVYGVFGIYLYYANF
jgi:MFS family permease